MPEIPTVDECLRIAYNYLNFSDPTAGPDAEDASISRAWVGLASVLLQQQHLEGMRASDARQEEQVRIQRLAVGPLPSILELVEDVARAAGGQWSAGDVNGWVAQAREILTFLGQVG